MRAEPVVQSDGFAPWVVGVYPLQKPPQIIALLETVIASEPTAARSAGSGGCDVTAGNGAQISHRWESRSAMLRSGGGSNSKRRRSKSVNLFFNKP